VPSLAGCGIVVNNYILSSGFGFVRIRLVGSQIRILIRVKSWLRIHIKIKIEKL
jgi:hypothetical protein